MPNSEQDKREVIAARIEAMSHGELKRAAVEFFNAIEAYRQRQAEARDKAREWDNRASQLHAKLADAAFDLQQIGFRTFGAEVE